MGLRRLGCWLELLWLEGEADRRHIRTFAEAIGGFGLEDDFCLIYFPRGQWPEAGPEREWYRFSQDRFRDFCREADILLDLRYSVRPSDLLGAVSRAAFLDLDPVLMQRAKHQKAHDLPHDLFFTVGQNIGHVTCSVPTGGVEWHTFWPPVNLELWGNCGGNPDADFFNYKPVVGISATRAVSCDNTGMPMHNKLRVISLHTGATCKAREQNSAMASKKFGAITLPTAKPRARSLESTLQPKRCSKRSYVTPAYRQ